MWARRNGHGPCERGLVTDIRLVLGAQGADLEIVNGDFRLDLGLSTAVLISLFSDRRLEEDEELEGGETDRRGWWADSAADRYGSHLWRFDRSKMVPSTQAGVEGAARESLQWLKSDGIAGEVEVSGEVVGSDRIDLTVRPKRGLARRWESIWAGVEAEDFHADGFRVRIVPG